MGKDIIDAYFDIVSNKPDTRAKEIADTLTISKNEISLLNLFIKSNDNMFKKFAAMHPRFVNESCSFVTENAKEIRDFLLGTRIYPLIVEIHPGAFCNYKCEFCFSGGDDYDEHLEHLDTLRPEKFDEICRDCKKNDVREIWFSGGKEPLTNKNSIHFIETANYYGFRTRIYTNGILLNPSDYTLADCNQIRISINAAKNETYMKVCGVKNITTFDILADKIKDLVYRKRESNGKFKAKIAVSFMIQRSNYNEVYAFFEKFLNVGVDSIQFRLDSIGRVPKLTPKERMEVISQSADIVEYMIKNKPVLDLSLRGITEEEFDRELLPGLNKPKVCMAGMIKRGINPWGIVYNCEYASHPHFKGESKNLILGDVNKSSFGDIMKSSANKFPPVCKFCQAHEYGINVLLPKLFDDLKFGLNIEEQIFYKG